MSKTKSNYQKETQPLFKLLRTDAFRFIPVKYDNYALIEQLIEDLKKRYPKRTITKLDGSNTDYRTLMDSYFSIDTGFLFIENFDQILADPTIYQGINQRRDKLANKPNAIFALMPSITGDKWARPIMEKMPDLWSFRSYLLELETNWGNSEYELKLEEAKEGEEIGQSNRLVINYLTIEVEEIPNEETIKASTIGGRSSKEKRQYLQQILREIKSTPLAEIELLKKLYWQVFKLYDDLRDFKQALKILEKIEPFIEGESERANWLVNYGIANYNLNKLDCVEKYYNEALEIYKKLTDQNTGSYLPYIAKTIHNLANLEKAKNKLDEAERNYNDALKIRRELAKNDSNTFLPDIAATLNNLAILQSFKNQQEKAERSYEEALQIRRQLASNSSEIHLSEVAGTLNNMGLFQAKKNDLITAEKSYMEALEIRKNLATKNPDTYLADVGMTLHNLAILQKDKNEWQKAEKHFNDALEIRQKLAKESPEAYLSDVASTFNSLANLYKVKNEWQKAENGYTKALEYYKELAKTNPETYQPDVAMVTINLSILYHKKQPDKAKSIFFAKEAILASNSFINTLPGAKVYFNQAIQILKELEVDPQEFLEELGIKYPL